MFLRNIVDSDFSVGRKNINHTAIGTHFETIGCRALEHGVTRQFTQHGFNRLERAKGLAAANANIRLHFVDDDGLLSLGGKTELGCQRQRLFRAGRYAQSALHTVLLNEAELRRLRIVLQGSRWAGIDATQAQGATLPVDAQRAQWRAFIRQGNDVGPDIIALPDKGSPLGALRIDRQRCTLCLSCVNACPSAALQDNPQTPQLSFIEKNCVQCGLCVTTCPEKALALTPQFSLSPQRKQAVVINEMQPYVCIRCSKPFGTLKAIESMLGKLAGHAMFQGAAADRLKMCADCRVIDIFSSDTEVRIDDIP